VSAKVVRGAARIVPVPGCSELPAVAGSRIVLFDFPAASGTFCPI
jgi:hypothetical protein